MRSIISGLGILFFLLQYQLWFAGGGLFSAVHRHRDINKQIAANAMLEKRNDQLKKDIQDLKHGEHALEEHARTDLGMIKKDETFYQVVNRK